MTTITDRIRKIAPQYQPDAADIRWIETELDRVADKALPKLVRKRFVETLRSTDQARVSVSSLSVVKAGMIMPPSVSNAGAALKA